MAGQQSCYECGLTKYTVTSGSISSSSCQCNAGFTQATGQSCTNCIVSVQGFTAQYLYQFRFYLPDKVGNTYWPTEGGTPSTFTLNTGEFIMRVKYRPFIASWESYLGCSIILETSQGRSFSFTGTRSLEAEVCGEETQFPAGPGQMITGFRFDTSGTNQNTIIDVLTTPTPICIEW